MGFSISSPGASGSFWTWTLDIGMLRHVHYHTATPASLNAWIWMAFFIKILEKTSGIDHGSIFYPGANGSFWTWTLGIEMMRQVLYHSATPAGLNSCSWMAFFIKILEKTSGIYDGSIFSPGANGSFGTWTLGIGMTRKMLYHSATSTSLHV